MSKPRRFTIDQALDDTRAHIPGDLLVSARTVYRITDVRPVESRIWPNRWAITCIKVGTATDHIPDRHHHLESGCTVSATSTYRRGEGPHDHFGAPREETDAS